MLKKSFIPSFLVIAYFFLVAFPTSHPTSATGGYTGAPLDGFCTSCHINQDTELSGEFHLRGIPPILFPGETYNVSIEVSNPKFDAVRAGFQLVALEADLSNGGDLMAISQDAVRKVAAGRRYLGHSPAKVFDPNGIASWLAQWSIEDNDEGELTIYGVSIIGSGSNGNQDDKALYRQWRYPVASPSDTVVALIEIIEPIGCKEEEIGVISIRTYGGIPPYTYEWNTGDTTAILENAEAGEYIITVTDSLNHIWQDTLIFSPREQLIIDSLILENVSTSEADDGYSAINVSGGIPPYSYRLYDMDAQLIDSIAQVANLPSGQYTWEVIDSRGCMIISEIEIALASSVIENKKTSLLQVSPNPTSDMIYFRDHENLIYYELYNANGRMIKKNQLNNPSISINYLPGGVYFINVYTTERIMKTAKIIKY